MLKKSVRNGVGEVVQEPPTLQGTSTPHLSPSEAIRDGGGEWGSGPQGQGKTQRRRLGAVENLENWDKACMCHSEGRGDSPNKPQTGDSLRLCCGVVGTFAN